MEVVDPYEKLAVTHLPLSIQSHVLHLAHAIGATPDQLILVILMTLAIPLGFLHKKLPNPTSKHVYCIVLGVLFNYALTGPGVLHTIAMAVIAYVLVMILPRKIAPTVIFCYAMSHLSYRCAYKLSVGFLCFL